MSRRLLRGIAIIALTSCSNLDGPKQSTSSDPPRRPPTVLRDATVAADDPVYEEVFTRTRGAPDQFTRTFPSTDFDGPFVLHVRNGAADGSDRVSSGTVAIDGRVLLADRDLSRQVGDLAYPVALGQTATLTVSLASEPGSFLDVWIEGVRRVFHVCPVNVAGHGSFATIADAVAAVPASATIRLCTAVHPAESVVVDRTLTFEPEVGATPTVRNATTTGALVLAGSAPGTVTVRGIAFANDAGPRDNVNRAAGSFSLRAFGSPLNLSVETSRFVTSASGNGGIGVADVPSPTTALTVDHSAFSGGLFGVYTNLAGAVTVHGSVFTHLDNFGARIGAASTTLVADSAEWCGGTCFVAVGGTSVIANSAARLCGQSACASAAGSVTTIRGNWFSNRLPGVVPAYSQHVILLFSRASGRVENNFIDGCGGGECIAAVQGGGPVDVVGNRITAYFDDGTRQGIIASDNQLGNAPPGNGVAMNVTGNTLVGIGGAPPVAPGDTVSAPFRIAALQWEGFSSGTASGNSVHNAGIGILVRRASVLGAGSGNVIDGARTAVVISDAGSAAVLHGNDFTNSMRSIVQSAGPGSDLSCNWWGSAAGPVSFFSSQGPSLWTPWATAPIAATGATSCTP